MVSDSATGEAPVEFARAVLAGYARRGVDPADALRRARIPAAALRRDGVVGAAQLETLAAVAVRELADEAIGWFAAPLRWGTYGMLCRASMTSPNLGVALRRWFRHHALVASEIELDLSVRGETATVAIHPLRDLGATRDFCLFSYLRFVHRFGCWASDIDIPLIAARLPCARPAYDDFHRRAFPCALAFDAARASISFPARLLDAPLCRDDDALRAMLRRPQPMAFLRYDGERQAVQRVRGILNAAQAGDAGADAVARRLHVSTRTLARRLQAEGASFQRLKDETRRERALRLLRETERPLKLIATALGFANDKTFSRAFRNWTGDSPGRYRRRARPGPS